MADKDCNQAEREAAGELGRPARSEDDTGVGVAAAGVGAADAASSVGCHSRS